MVVTAVAALAQGELKITGECLNDSSARRRDDGLDLAAGGRPSPTAKPPMPAD
jgi:hypothetical protein